MSPAVGMATAWSPTAVGRADERHEPACPRRPRRQAEQRKAAVRAGHEPHGNAAGSDDRPWERSSPRPGDETRCAAGRRPRTERLPDGDDLAARERRPVERRRQDRLRRVELARIRPAPAHRPRARENPADLAAKRIQAAVALPSSSTATRGGDEFDAVSRSFVGGRHDMPVAASATAAVRAHAKRASATSRNGVRRAGGRAWTVASLVGAAAPGQVQWGPDPGSNGQGLARRPHRRRIARPSDGFRTLERRWPGSSLRPVTLLALACALVAAPPAAAAGPEATANALARTMRAAGAASGALAVDLDSGPHAVPVRPDTARIPASVEKLYTTSTALLRLGPEETLTTTALGEVRDRARTARSPATSTCAAAAIRRSARARPRSSPARSRAPGCAR